MVCMPTCIRACDPHDCSFGGEVWGHLHPDQRFSTVKFVTGVSPELTKIPQTINYSSNSDRFLIRMLVPVDFRSNREQLDANSDEFARKNHCRPTCGAGDAADGAGSAAGRAGSVSARAGQLARRRGRRRRHSGG
jgi:hypothetical protein